MSEQPFADLPPSPGSHFTLYFYAAVLQLLDRVARALGSPEAALEHFPFLAGYQDELRARGLGQRSGDAAADWWRTALFAWEVATTAHLPLRAVREAACLDHSALTLLMSIGLVEEDPRFGLLYDFMQGGSGQHRPLVGLLQTWSERPGAPGELRATLRRLRELGLVQVTNPDAPRIDWALQVPGMVWDTARGDTPEWVASWARYQPPAALTPLEELIVPEGIRHALATIPPLLASGEAQALVVRGPRQNGRRTVLAATARGLGRGILELSGLGGAEDQRWSAVGPLATLLHAMPVAVFDLAPAETAEVPRLAGLDGPLGVVLGRQGGLAGPAVKQALTLTLEMPDVRGRLEFWQRTLAPRIGADVDAIAERFRLTSGNLRRAAHLAQPYARLSGREAVTLADVQQASRALNRQALDTLAAFVPTSGDWSHVAVHPDTLAELRALERRCRHRERLAAAAGHGPGAQSNAGVRALFSGPSGTGKTLAARLLASMLQMDLYRLDLSTVVNKYIGETEKNLSQVFACAEELDIVLLLDEGDALLTQRTSVQTANDRYANLETNYLLQRLETFEGILIITSNASHRIDDAFQRRMDVVIDFRAPDPSERFAIWQLHLPPAHTVQPQLLEDVARRCALSGGQIRNAVVHASLLGLENGGRVNSCHLQAAIEREYRKLGAVCPLRASTGSLAGG